MSWTDTDIEPYDGQIIDVWLFKHEFYGSDAFRLTKCIYWDEYGYLDSEDRVIAKYYPGYRITHWMPAPEPPKGYESYH